MKKWIVLLLSFVSLQANELIIKESANSVDMTIKKIKKIVEKKGLSVFAVIDHQKNATKVNMNLDEAKLIVFGNPKIGTKLMQDDIRVGLELPMKILVYKDSEGKTKILYKDMKFLADSFDIKQAKILEKVDKALGKITLKAGQAK